MTVLELIFLCRGEKYAGLFSFFVLQLFHLPFVNKLTTISYGIFAVGNTSEEKKVKKESSPAFIFSLYNSRFRNAWRLIQL